MNYKNNFKSDLFVFFLFLLILYSIFRFVGTFYQGFDIVEDQLLIKVEQSIDSMPDTDVLEQMIKNDVDGLKRFRPFWVLFLYSIVKLFGLNLFLINVFNAVLCVITCFLLYKFCRIIGFNIVQSFLFALLTAIGPATIMWIRVMDAEIVGMLMLSVTLIFLSKSVYSPKNIFFYKSGFIVFALITSLCKENFLIIIPALLLLYLWLYSLKNKTGFIQSIKENYKFIILTVLILTSVVYSMLNAVGVNKNHGYAGVSVSLFSLETVSNFLEIVFTTNIFLIFSIGFIIYLDSELRNKKLLKEYFTKELNNIVFLLGFMLLVIVPQYIFYSKTGFIGGRYYLPYLIGFSFITIYLLKLIFESVLISYSVKYLYLTTIIVFISLELITVTFPSLKKYSDECKETTEVLKSLINNPNGEILFVMDPVQNYPEVYTMKIYLDYFKAQKEYKYDFIKRNYLHPHYADTSFYNKTLTVSEKNLSMNKIDSTVDNSNINCILVLNSLDSKFIEKNKYWFNINKYQKRRIGTYILYSQ